MALKINEQNISKVYVGLPPTDATKIPMSSTDKTTVAEKANNIDMEISQLNNGLTTEIAERKNTMWNPNILHNSDFRNPVNQRGESIYLDYNSYTIDRWLQQVGISGTVSTTVHDGYITVSGGTVVNFFTQRIEHKLDFSGNTTYTFSLKLLNGVMYKHSFTREFTIEVAEGLLLRAHEVSNSIQVLANSGFSFDLVAIKLELGSISTLANDPPQNYGAELAKCQRYLVELNTYKTHFATMGTGKPTTPTNIAEIHVRVPVPLRIIPTVIKGGQLGLLEDRSANSNRSNIPITNISVNAPACSATSICLTCETDTTLIMERCYEIIAGADANATLLLSAEL